MPRTYPFSVQVTDDVGATATRSFSIDVNNSDFDRYAYVNQNGIGRSKDGENWQFDLSATNKGDFIFWCRDRWLLIDGVTTGQTLKQSFDLRSWQTISITTSPGTYIFPTFFYYSDVNDTLYLGATDAANGGSLIEKIINFSTITGTAWTSANFQAVANVIPGHIVDFTLNVTTNIAFFTTYATLDVYRLEGNTVNASFDTGVQGRVWFSNDVLLAFNTRGSQLFQVSFDDGLTFIDKSPTPPGLTDTITNYVYLNGVFTLMYRDGSNVTRLEYTTNLGDTWTNGSTGGGYNTTNGGVCMSLAYNGRRINIDNVGQVRVFSGNTSNTYVGSASLGQSIASLGQSGNFAAVRVEAL